MKKILLAVAILISAGSYAQKFQLGAKAGVNISNFTGGDFDAVKKKALVGFHGGLFLRFSVLKFSIQPEMMISTQGAVIDSVSGGSYDWRVTYATIPVMLQFKLAAGFFIEAGPQVAFKISDNIEDETIGEFAKNLDLSVAAGLGFRLKGLGFGARYTVGISKVGDFQQSSNINPDFKNAVAQLSLYIPLTAGK